MTRFRRAVQLVAVAALLLTLAGCKWFEVSVQITDFDSKKVSGLWMWRKDEATGQWQRAGQIVFEPTSTSASAKQLEYVLVGDGGTALPMKAPIERDAKVPDKVKLKLWYARYLEPGQYRISSYNQAGESPLSPEVLDLL